MGDNEWPADALGKDTCLHAYRIESVLGRGAFGITYRATDAFGQVFALNARMQPPVQRVLPGR